MPHVARDGKYRKPGSETRQRHFRHTVSVCHDEYLTLLAIAGARPIARIIRQEALKVTVAPKIAQDVVDKLSEHGRNLASWLRGEHELTHEQMVALFNGLAAQIKLLMRDALDGSPRYGGVKKFDNSRVYNFHVRLNQAEAQHIYEQARLAGFNPANYMRLASTGQQVAAMSDRNNYADIQRLRGLLKWALTDGTSPRFEPHVRGAPSPQMGLVLSKMVKMIERVTSALWGV